MAITVLVSASCCSCLKLQLWVQILTMRQQAACIVGAFPYAPDKLRVLEALASVRHEPSVSELMQPNGLDDFEHYANWQQIVHLLQQITKDNLHLHIPLVHF